MNEIAYIVFFFGGLFWTVKKGLQSQRPALWFLVSFIIRMGGVFLGFYLISEKGAFVILVSFVGFILMRNILKRACTHESES